MSSFYCSGTWVQNGTQLLPWMWPTYECVIRLQPGVQLPVRVLLQNGQELLDIMLSCDDGFCRLTLNVPVVTMSDHGVYQCVVKSNITWETEAISEEKSLHVYGELSSEMCSSPTVGLSVYSFVQFSWTNNPSNLVWLIHPKETVICVSLCVCICHTEEKVSETTADILHMHISKTNLPEQQFVCDYLSVYVSVTEKSWLSMRQRTNASLSKREKKLVSFFTLNGVHFSRELDEIVCSYSI